MNLIYRKLFFAILVFPLSVFAQKPVLKVDLNVLGRQMAEINEPGFLPWTVKQNDADTLVAKGIKIIFTKKGTNKLQTNYYKTAIQSPNYARLIGDGLIVIGDQDYAKLEMQIIGLPAGEHTILTYHNNLAATKDKISSSINIYVDGKLKIDGLIPSNQVLANNKGRTAYLSFQAHAGKPVILMFEANQSAPQGARSIVLNGFEMNTQNPADIAQLPLPQDGDEHVDTEKLHLQWTAAKEAVINQLYFGVDSTTVANAKTNSILFKGELKSPDYLIKEKLNSLTTYYWRVDEVTPSGKITKGNVWYFRPRQLAFIGAEGYGRFARGGRGGKVVEVTNLNDDGPGSFREAVTKNVGPRTVVFTVSGIITLKSRLVINQAYITVAGQTAPGKGICIRSAPVGVVGNDNVVRFIRVRLGSGTTYDGMGLTGANNSIVDHCSISWTIDESFSSRGAHNITLQRTLISEALNVAGHDKYTVGKSHGFAASVGGDVGSFHHNLLAHNAGRNWSLAGGADGDGYYLGRMDMRNNVVYNWAHRTTDGGAREVNFVANYYKPGAATIYKFALNAQHEGYGKGMQQYFFDGNIIAGSVDEKNQAQGRTSSGKVDYPTFVDKQFFEPYVTTQSATDAYKNVLSDVGCNMQIFDDHDIRIVNETLTGTYTYKGSKSGLPGLPDSQNDVGGWENYPALTRAANFDSDHDGLPDWWEKLHQTNPNSSAGDFKDANQDTDHDGFTNLDNYLQWMGEPHFFTQVGKSITIDLKQFALGYTEKPIFKIADILNGNATLKENVATFTTNKAGLGSFKFEVKDKAGSVYSKVMHVATN